jgi:hypothetical protein
MRKNPQSELPFRTLSARQLAAAAGGGGDLGNDWLVGGTGQDGTSSTGTGKTMAAEVVASTLGR